MKGRISHEGPQHRSIDVLVFELVSEQEKLRKIEKEIGITINRMQIKFLMATRKGLLGKIKSLRQGISSAMLGQDESDLRLFQIVCGVLNTFYGRGVGETILMAFERQAGFSAIEIINYPETFETVLVRTIGENAASRIGNVVSAEIAREFGLTFGKKASFRDAIQSAKSSVQFFIARTQN